MYKITYAKDKNIEMGMEVKSGNGLLFTSNGDTDYKGEYAVLQVHIITWSPHSLIIGMLMSSINIVIFLPAGGPKVLPILLST